MFAAHRQVVQDDVVVRLAPDGHALFAYGVFVDHYPIHAQYQFCRHSITPSRILNIQANHLLNHSIAFANQPRGAANPFLTFTRITETLSRPPLSFAIWINCSAASGKFPCIACKVERMSSSSTISFKPSEQSR